MDFAWMAFSQTWQVTFLVILVLVITRLFAKNRPHLAYMLWLVVLIKCVAPPFWSSPTSAFTWLQTAMSAEDTLEPDRFLFVNYSRLGINIDTSQEPLPDVNRVLVTLPPSDFQSAEAVAVAPYESPRIEWSYILLAVWGTGFGGALLVSGLRSARCIRMLHNTPSVDSPELERLLAQLTVKLRVRRRVRLLVTTSRVGPAVIGLLRPLIVVPEIVVRNRAPEELEAILAHELIHVRRGDLWLGLLQVCSRAVWWFYPLVWWVNRLSTRQAERCCDEEVIGELRCDPRRYASSLLDILELKRTLQTIPTFPGMKPVEVTSERLERIMKLGQGCHKRTPRWCWAVMFVTIAATLPGAAFIAAQEEAYSPDLFVEPASGGHPSIESIDHTASRQSASSAPLSVAAYSSDAIIAKLKAELQCDDSQAMQAFGNMLVQQSGLINKAVPLQDRLRIQGRAIHVAASDEEHERLREAVEWLEEYPVALLTIEIKFISVPEQLVDRTIHDWQLTPADLGNEVARELPNYHQDSIDRPFPTDQAKPLAKAGVSTTTNLPALYKVLDAKPAMDLLTDFQKDKRTKVISAPKVTLFSGQPATIADATRHPFVVGLKPSRENANSVEPQILVVECGNIVQIRPLLRSDNNLWIDYDVKVSRLDDVSQRVVQVAGQDNPLTLQVPKVVTARIESAVEFEPGKTVVLGGVPVGDGSRNQLVVMLQAVCDEHPRNNAIEIPELQTGALMFGTDIDSDVGLAGTLSVEDGEQGIKNDTANRYPVVYNVADLIAEDLESITPPSFTRTSENRMGHNLNLLESVIPKQVAPESWKDNGGRGAIEAFPTNLSLVVSQSEEGHRQLRVFLHDLRTQLKLPSSQTFSPARKLSATRSRKLVNRIYNVADLVIPLPNSNRPSGRDETELLSTTAPADFSTLTDLITSTVAPDSWRVAGGAGQIKPFSTNLSLLILQTSEVHEQIVALLHQLRRLQDVQVTVEARFFCVPTDLFHQAGLDFQSVNDRRRDFVSEPMFASGPEDFTESEMKFFVRAVQALESASLLMAPKVTLFNGRQTRLTLPNSGGEEPTTLQLQPVCSDDHRSVRLSFGIGVGNEVATCSTKTILAEHSLIVDISDRVKPESLGWNAMTQSGSSILNKIPYASRLFVDSHKEVKATQMWMSLTPRIVDQEEKTTNFSIVTPPLIIGEEEELLGLGESNGSAVQD
ncbi:MAG: hypothetical protein H6822_32885 [Planctomycetaceae bacterium]|nr:hypothetical protein [Planctomycetales bacterium]MCB9926981.1 hypothetical protein [Planctomycetaceae bacterium]